MFDYDDKNVFTKIENYKNLIKKQKDEIAEREIIINSLNNSLVRYVKSIIIPYSNKMLYSAWKQQNKENKEDKSMYDFIKKDLIERFFNGDKKAKLVDIIACGYENYAYNFEFNYYDIKFEIQIPNVVNVTQDSLSLTNYGKYILRYECKPSCWDLIVSSYSEDDIANAIKEFVEKRK